jgi:hypothetical protein
VTDVSEDLTASVIVVKIQKIAIFILVAVRT